MDGTTDLALRIRVSRKGETVLGPGRADLLMYIGESGSIAAAGRRMGMSYKRAWVLVEAMNRDFAAPLVTAAKGGSGGGGAKLTACGAGVLADYRALQEAAELAGLDALTRLNRALGVPPRCKSG